MNPVRSTNSTFNFINFSKGESDVFDNICLQEYQSLLAETTKKLDFLSKKKFIDLILLSFFVFDSEYYNTLSQADLLGGHGLHFVLATAVKCIWTVSIKCLHFSDKKLKLYEHCSLNSFMSKLEF